MDTALSDSSRVVVLGHQHADKAFVVRDFLERNVVPYAWHDMNRSEPAREMAQRLGMSGDAAVTVVLPDCRVLHDPSLIDLALALDLTRPAKSDTYDLVIVGGGPAGLACGVYAGCEGMKVVMIEDDAPGGQAGSTSRIENYLGFPSGIGGAELARAALTQAKGFGVEWLSARVANRLGTDGDWRTVGLADGSVIRGRAVLIATGMQWRRHPAPGVDRFINAGVYYGSCLSEAATVAGEDVYMVGAGNSAGQAALAFARYARSVTMLVRTAELDTMSHYLIERLKACPNISVRTRTEVVESLGDTSLTGLVLRDGVTGSTETVPAAALYLLIGATPCTEWCGDLIGRDDHGFVLTGTEVVRDDRPLAVPWSAARDPLLMETNVPGVFAAGDVRSGSVKRVGSAIGQGAVALQAINEYLGSMVTASAKS
ncbi:FAD-dependent oxidoreductase [Nocardia sp. NPDC051030]|uniref:NAD(P)/FAD-dependent oxidoreductase n=1 Tax=Nocardia sp. NPDC051030 TaxID=3155162 RepID=UPI0034186EF0